MPADLAALAIAAVFLFAGFGVLAATGLPAGGPWALLGAAGAAYMTGLSSVLMLGNLLLVAGIAVSVPVFILTGAVVGAGGFAVWARRGDALQRHRSRTASRSPVALRWDAAAVRGWVRRRPLVLIAAAVFLVVAVWGYRWAQVTPLTDWDAWSIWARKGEILFSYGTPKPSFFASPWYAFMHPDYPLLLPLLESIWFRFLGSPDTTSLHVQFWLFYVASLSAAAYFVSRFSPARIWIPVLGFIAFIPALTSQLMTMYADVPMGLLLMVGVMLLGMWIVDHRRPHLLLAMLFLAASANTKDEGVSYAVVAMFAAFLCCVIRPEAGRRRVDVTALLLGAAGFAVLVLPWRVWVVAHDLSKVSSPDVPTGKGLDPGYLIGQIDRLGPTLTALYQQLTDQGIWAWLLPLGIALTLACLLTRRMLRLSSFFAVTGVGVFLVTVWAYVAGTLPISWWLGTSASRIVDGTMFVSAAAILSLTGALTGPAAGRESS
jgi:hypothetical protein